MSDDVSEVLAAHYGSDDWKCHCGHDCFGGSGAYSLQLLYAHIADKLEPLFAAREAAAEQRGREDNADHGMCYVHGSKALEARLREERETALREAAEHLTFGVHGVQQVEDAAIWLHERADLIKGRA